MSSCGCAGSPPPHKSRARTVREEHDSLLSLKLFELRERVYDDEMPISTEILVRSEPLGIEEVLCAHNHEWKLQLAIAALRVKCLANQVQLFVNSLTLQGARLLLASKQPNHCEQDQ